MSRYDTIEEVRKHASEAKTFDEILKFNENHDRLGRFTSSGGGGAASAGKYQKLTHADAIAMAKEMGQDQMSNADVNQMTDRVAGYFGTRNSFTINEDLRESAENGWDDPVLDDWSYETVEALDRNMRPSTRNIQLARMTGDWFLESLGIDADPYDYDEKGLEEMQKAVGKVFSNGGYSSTSFDMEKNVFKSRPVKLNINAPKGTKMLVSPERYGDEIAEAEILLARGTAMKVTGIRPKYRNGSAYGIEVDCEVLID